MRPLVIAALAVGLAGAAQGQGWTSALPRTHPYNVPTPLADDPSPFVHVPARVGFYSGMLAGLVPGVMVGLPLALIDRATTGETSRFTSNVIQAPSVYTGVAMHYAAGLPFYMAKVAFWTFPRALLGVKSRGASRAPLMPSGGP